MKKEKKKGKKRKDNEKARKKLTIKVKLTELRKARHARMTTADLVVIWETICSGKPSPRDEVLNNIDTSQGAALRVGQMKLLLNVPIVTWFKPIELDTRLYQQNNGVQSSKEFCSGNLFLVSYFSLNLFYLIHSEDHQT